MKDNQINQILVKVDIIKHKFLMYRPEVRKHKGKSLPIEIWSEVDVNLPIGSTLYGNSTNDGTGLTVECIGEIRNSGGRTYLVTVKE